MIKVGITGQSGFIGSNVHNYLSLQDNSIELVPFKTEFFHTDTSLETFVRKCDVLLHLAAVNRSNNPDELFKTNISLVKKLVTACETTQSTPKILFASSIQELRNNTYGNSKKEGFSLLENWAKKNSATVIKLVIPNVFGPLSKPYHNSVIATFCDQLIKKKMLNIIEDNSVNLIYSNELSEIIYKTILSSEKGVIIKNIPHSITKKVSEIKDILTSFHTQYSNNNTIPNIETPFFQQLFTTYLSFVPYTQLHRKLNKHIDERGDFSELLRTQSSAQFSFSSTKPGVTRGNHFHTRKIERFTVIKGSALIKLRRINTDRVIEFNLEGNEPSCVDIPAWHTHSITNTGKGDLITIFWINEHYNSLDPDTYTENV